MKIEKIKVTAIDDSLPYLFPTRTMEIKTTKGTISTPNRCATSYEFNRKQELPTATTIDTPVTTYTKKLTGKEVRDLLTTNTEYGKILDGIEKVDRLTEYSTLHYLPFLGNDLYAILQPAPAIIKPEDRNKPKNIENLKVLNTKDLTVNPLLKKTVTAETIISEIDSKEERQLKTILENLVEAITDNQKYKVVNALTRVHELKSSTKEFSKLHEHITERSSKDYIKSKVNFDDRLKKI